MFSCYRSGSGKDITMPKALTLDDAGRLAESRGGICLSDAYVDSTTKLQWRCAEGQWCPSCEWYKTERMCREACEAATGHHFPTQRPTWLGGLELDGYCEELGVAFEYNGQQDDTHTPFFHRNGPEDLETQRSATP